MVFPGRFSTGCLRCRQRKVKCDETRPSCRRCSIYGKPCTGYTDQFRFRYSKNDQNAAEKRSSNSSVNTKVIAKKSSSQARSWDQAVVRGPQVCYEDVSLCYFVRRFVSPNGADGFPGHLSFLPGIYDFYSNGIFETATLSVAQMAAYNQFGGEEFRVQSYKSYGRAIRMMQDIIQSEEQATDDKVIASILLLCDLKDINGDGSGDPNEHAPGLFYLINKRGMGQIATDRGAELLFLALIRLQIYAFLHEDDTYSDPGSIASIWGAINPLLRALSIMSRILSLRHSLLRHYTSLESQQEWGDHDAKIFNDDGEGQEITLIIESCFEALDDLHAWDIEAASYWLRTFEGRGVPTALGEVASGTTYYDVETACTIILVRSARLILLMSMIVYNSKIQLLDDCELDMHSSCAVLAECIPALQHDVSKTIEDILSSVPYALGDIDPRGLPASVPHDGAAAIVIVHPIRLVASCAYATTDQVQRAMAALKRFNAGIGIRSAVDLGKDHNPGLRWVQEQAFLHSRALAS